MNKNILITGASSGIGAALAIAYARRGVTLGLIGRNGDRLEEIASKAMKKGAKVVMGIIDVRDKHLMKEFIASFDRKHEIDLVIANAGISAGDADDEDYAAVTYDLFSTNIDGVLNTILPIIPFMKKRQIGQIAIMSSLAGIRGLPSCPAYSASKAAVRFYGEGLRGALKSDGIDVSVICPGYIKTPLTAKNKFPMPFIMTPEKACEIIMKGLENKRSRIAFPLALYIPLWLLTCLPVALTDRLFAMLPRK